MTESVVGSDLVTTVEFRGRVIDLTRALPLRMRDALAMEKQGIDLQKFGEGQRTASFQFVLYVLKKADATVTEDELADLIPDAFNELSLRVGQVEEELKKAERPFAARSTSSAAPTTGAPTT